MEDKLAIVSRRSMINMGMAGLFVGVACSQSQSTEGYTLDKVSQLYPYLHKAFGNPVMELLVEAGTTESVGEGPLGQLRVVPIVGGEFRGTGLKGIVRAGGTDRQLIRKDGIKELDARYELEAEDGTIIFVHNKVLIDSDVAEGEKRYVRSVVKLEVPEGRHSWLNRRVLIGTLDSLRPEQPFVFIRFYQI